MWLGKFLFERSLAIWGNWFGTSAELPPIDVERVFELARMLHEKNRPLDLIGSNVALEPSNARAFNRD